MQEGRWIQVAGAHVPLDGPPPSPCRGKVRREEAGLRPGPSPYGRGSRRNAASRLAPVARNAASRCCIRQSHAAESTAVAARQRARAPAASGGEGSATPRCQDPCTRKASCPARTMPTALTHTPAHSTPARALVPIHPLLLSRLEPSACRLEALSSPSPNPDFCQESFVATKKRPFTCPSPPPLSPASHPLPKKNGKLCRQSGRPLKSGDWLRANAAAQAEAKKTRVGGRERREIFIRSQKMVGSRTEERERKPERGEKAADFSVRVQLPLLLRGGNTPSVHVCAQTHMNSRCRMEGNHTEKQGVGTQTCLR